jgi:hypothetical protein
MSRKLALFSLASAANHGLCKTGLIALVAAIGCSSPAGNGNGSGANAGSAAAPPTNGGPAGPEGAPPANGGGPPVITSNCAPANVGWGLPQTTTLHAGSYFVNMTAGDLNRDGKADLVVLENDGVEVFVSNGDGTFKPGKFSPQDRGNGYAIAAADFHGTGSWDVLVSTVQSDPNVMSAALYAGGGDGTLRSTAASVPIGSSYILKGMAADFNADHKIDFIYDAQTASGDPGVVMNRGGADFAGPRPLKLPSVWTVGDLNTDGAADIFGSSPDGKGACAFMNDGSGQFAPTPACYPGPPNLPVHKAAIGDIDGDGKMDAISVYDGGGGVEKNNIAAYLNKGGGKLGDPVISNLEKDMMGLALADVNNDGKADFVAFATSSETSALVEILLSKGDGTFAATPIEMAMGREQGGDEQNPAIADFAGNGLRGIAVQKSNSNGIDVVVAMCKK